MPVHSGLLWLVPGAGEEKKPSFIIVYSRLTQALVSHPGQLFPVTNAQRNEIMHRRICVTNYDFGDRLHLVNTEAEFVRPTTASATSQSLST